MEEKLIGKKNGMTVLLLEVLVYALAIAGVGYGAASEKLWLIIPSVIVLCTAWIFLLGLKVLKPQEALVLTLFGKYIGTIKGEGFYFSEEVGFVPKVKEPNKQKGENKNGKEKGGKQKPKK